MVNRVIRDDPGKGSMHNRQAVTIKLLWEALCDYDLWPIYLLGLTWLIPPIPATTYLTLQLGSLGFTTFQTNLLTIPAYVIFIVNLLFWTWVSERFNQRLLLGVVAEVWNLVLLIALEVLPTGGGAWPKWAILTLLVGSPYIHAVVVAITSRNAGSVRTRTVASALYNIGVQACNIIGNNVSNLQLSWKVTGANTYLMISRSTEIRISLCIVQATKFLSPFLFGVCSYLLQQSVTTCGRTSMFLLLLDGHRRLVQNS